MRWLSSRGGKSPAFTWAPSVTSSRNTRSLASAGTLDAVPFQGAEQDRPAGSVAACQHTGAQGGHGEEPCCNSDPRFQSRHDPRRGDPIHSGLVSLMTMLSNSLTVMNPRRGNSKSRIR